MPNIQVCHVVTAEYAPNAATAREPFRAEHLERLSKLFEEGALVMAGPFDDMSATMLVLAVETPEAAEAIVKTDIYFKKGIWTGFSMRKLNRVEFDG